MNRLWIAFTPYVFVSILHLVAILVGAQGLVDVTATACMPLLLLGIIVVLWPRLGAFTVSIALYGLILAGTAVATTRCHPVIAWGGAAFLASDTFLSLVIFLPEWVGAWGFPMAMLTYNGGQGLLALGAMIVLSRQTDQSEILVPSYGSHILSPTRTRGRP